MVVAHQLFLFKLVVCKDEHLQSCYNYNRCDLQFPSECVHITVLEDSLPFLNFPATASLTGIQFLGVVLKMTPIPSTSAFHAFSFKDSIPAPNEKLPRNVELPENL